MSNYIYLNQTFSFQVMSYPKIENVSTWKVEIFFTPFHLILTFVYDFLPSVLPNPIHQFIHSILLITSAA